MDSSQYFARVIKDEKIFSLCKPTSSIAAGLCALSCIMIATIEIHYRP